MMIVMSSPAMAQDVDSITDVESEKIFGEPEMQPTFNGDINLWLAQNMRYPKEAVKITSKARLLLVSLLRKTVLSQISRL